MQDRKLVRTQRGTMIHRADCVILRRRNANHRVWTWADNKSRGEIVCTIIRYGYTTCEHCRPVDPVRIVINGVECQGDSLEDANWDYLRQAGYPPEQEENGRKVAALMAMRTRKRHEVLHL